MYSVSILIYVAMYLYSNPYTPGISALTAGGAWKQFEARLKMTIRWTQWYTPRPWSSEFRDAIGERDWVDPEIHWEAVMEQVCRWNWSTRLSELRDAYWGCDWANLEMHLGTEIEWTQRCTRRPWLSEVGNAIGGGEWAILEMHFEAVIERVWRCNWRPGLSELGDTLWGRDQVSLEMHLEAMIEWTWRCTSQLRSSESGEALIAGYDWVRLEGYLAVVDEEGIDGRCARCWDSVHRLVQSEQWACDEVTLPLKLLWRTGMWRSISTEVRSKLNLQSVVNSKSWQWMDNRQTQVYAVLSVCCTQCMLHSVFAALGVCCTQCMLHSVYAALSVNP